MTSRSHGCELDAKFCEFFLFKSLFVGSFQKVYTTVDGRNPAPPDMFETQ